MKLLIIARYFFGLWVYITQYRLEFSCFILVFQVISMYNLFLNVSGRVVVLFRFKLVFNIFISIVIDFFICLLTLLLSLMIRFFLQLFWLLLWFLLFGFLGLLVHITQFRLEVSYFIYVFQVISMYNLFLNVSSRVVVLFRFKLVFNIFIFIVKNFFICLLTLLLRLMIRFFLQLFRLLQLWFLLIR